MNVDFKNPDNWNREVFNAVLRHAQFRLLDYPERYGWEGAGNDCLYASTDDVEILLENGAFHVYGLDSNDETWGIVFIQSGDDDGERIC